MCLCFWFPTTVVLHLCMQSHVTRSQTQLAWRCSVIYPLKVMWQHLRASNVRLVPSSPGDMALCQSLRRRRNMFVLPTFILRHQKVSCSPRSLGWEGWMSDAFYFLLPCSLVLVPSLLLSASSAIISHLLIALSILSGSALSASPVFQQLPCIVLEKSGYATAHANVINIKTYIIFAQPHSQRQNTYLPIKQCSLLGWPLNGFDTHYQLSLMWN